MFNEKKDTNEDDTNEGSKPNLTHLNSNIDFKSQVDKINFTTDQIPNIKNSKTKFGEERAINQVSNLIGNQGNLFDEIFKTENNGNQEEQITDSQVTELINEVTKELNDTNKL